MKTAEEIYKELKEITRSIFVHSEQMVAIAYYFENELKKAQVVKKIESSENIDTKFTIDEIVDIFNEFQDGFFGRVMTCEAFEKAVRKIEELKSKPNST